MKISKLFLSAALSLSIASAVDAQSNLGSTCGCPAVSARPNVLMSSLADASGNITTRTLSCQNTYILDNAAGSNGTGKFYVGNGQILTIENGSLIKGMPETTANTSKNGGVLVISRGGKINAAGTEACPIVFTSTLDVLVDGTYGIQNKGKWGGLIVLGKASNNLTTGNGAKLGVPGLLPGTGRIEGFDSPEPRIYYGANSADPVAAFQAFDDADNSGVMTYVSIRHGGEKVGADNEINGLTLGSVGSGTTIHHIEVISNLDDGIEFFGGSVDLKYANVSFSDDDAFDWDQGWKGRGQFWVSVKTDQVTASGGDNGFEADGDDDLQGLGVMSNPNVYNATYIGSLGINGRLVAPKGIAVEMKEQTNGTIRNSVFANYGTGARFADNPNRLNGNVDAYDNWIAGTLKVECNAFAGVTTMLTKSLTAPTGSNTASPALNLADSTKFFTTDKNEILAADLDVAHVMNVSTNAVSNKINLVPSANLALASGCVTAPADGFFTAAAYKGAFEAGQPSWLTTLPFYKLVAIESALPAAPVNTCPTDINKNGLTDVSDFFAITAKLGVSCN